MYFQIEKYISNILYQNKKNMQGEMGFILLLYFLLFSMEMFVCEMGMAVYPPWWVVGDFCGLVKWEKSRKE